MEKFLVHSSMMQGMYDDTTRTLKMDSYLVVKWSHPYHDCFGSDGNETFSGLGWLLVSDVYSVTKLMRYPWAIHTDSVAYITNRLFIFIKDIYCFLRDRV